MARTVSEQPIRDKWADWLLHRRHGGDPAELQRALQYLYPVRDQVLDNAGLTEGKSVLDVGTGDGLIAFGALDRVGTTGRVVFSDISRDLLDLDQDLAERMGAASRCRFVQASADDLSAIDTATVDAVTTRSVLIYVEAKQRAFEEFFRVLRPGGRISIFEPVNRFGHDEPPDRFWGFDVSAVPDIAQRVRGGFQERQPIDRDPMMDFDERDLLAFAEHAGFEERHLRLFIDVEPPPPRPWESFVHTAFNPMIPTLAEAMDEVLAPTEAETFTAHLRPLVETGRGAFPLAVAYLWAVKR